VQRATFATVSHGAPRGTGDDSRVWMNEARTSTRSARRLVMMNSRWARFMGVAIAAIAAGLALCAEAASSDDQKLHVAAAPADFAVLGIDEWWYFDGLLDDGTVVVVWFGDNWFYGSHNRAVTLERHSGVFRARVGFEHIGIRSQPKNPSPRAGSGVLVALNQERAIGFGECHKGRHDASIRLIILQVRDHALHGGHEREAVAG
jgi:hypothetical protein